MRLISCLILAIALCLHSCSQPSKTRDVIDFTSDWKFYLGDVSDAEKADYDDSTWRILDLPHDWSIEGDFSLSHPATPGGGALPGGIGWYRKTFEISEADREKSIFIDFDGIYMNSSVWINGHFLGTRPNGYLSIRYDLTPYLEYNLPNTITVKVDNSAQPNARWYTGSGIYRNVWLTKVNSLHVDRWGTYVTTPKVSSQSAQVVISTTLRNKSEAKNGVLYTSIVDKQGKTLVNTKSSFTILQDSTTLIDQHLIVDNPKLWSIDEPYLYRVVTQVESDNVLVDEYTTDLGIRYFNFDADRGFSLNGESLKILGVCQHQDLGALGSVVNKRGIERQLKILKEMGCNSIRTSHNPPSTELLQLCDEMGFIVMNESFDVWRKRKTEHDYSRYFSEWYEQDLKEQVLRDRNHPSVFMWCIGNEVLEQWSHIEADTMDMKQANMILNFANTMDRPDGLSKGLHMNSLLAIKMADIVRELDSTRPITSGNNESSPTNHIFRSGAMDIIGFNYNHNNYADFHEQFPNQKLILTETTSALMSRGYYMMPSDSVFKWPIRWDIPFDRPIHHCSSYDHNHVPWGSTHEETWNLVKKHEHISGLYVWTGFDYLGEPTPFWWPSRSSFFGIVDLAGFPKDIYYMYQSEWTNKDVLHLFPHWNWEAGQIVDLWAYYNNADEVELFVNGKSQGRKQKKDGAYHVSWRVRYEAGIIKAVSYKDGKPFLEKEIKTTNQPSSIRLVADRPQIKADGKDLSYVTVEVLDKDGLAVPTANNRINFEIEGEGIIAGTDNGNPNDTISLKRPERHLFSGKAIAIIQSKKVKGGITLTAKSEGLKSASIRLRVK